MLEQLVTYEGLERDLAAVEHYIQEYLQTSAETGVLADVFHSVRNTKGKMVRPIFLLISAQFGYRFEQMRDNLCKLAALIEIIHTASLIHDDIIDDSPTRRGRSTVQAQFGKDIAVYAGDFMLSRVMCTLSRENMGASGVILGEAIEAMCRGELGQMTSRWDTETTMGTYLRNIYGKTTALFIGAARIGASESGCSETVVGYLSGVGENLGYMFQMRDDYLDFCSDELQEGKTVHKDFADGIYTMPVLFAFGTPCGDRLREIASLHPCSTDYAERLTEVRELIRSSGGLDFTLEQIKKHSIQAKRQLRAIPKCKATDMINSIFQYLSDVFVRPLP